MIAGIPVTVIFLVLAIVTGLLAGWLHFRMDYTGHTEVANTRRNRVLASTPLLVVAVIMVVLEVGSMAKGAAAALSRLHHRQGERRGIASGLSNTSCAMADDVLVEADTNAGMLQPVPGQRFGQYGPLGGENPVGFTPNGVSDTLEPAEPVTANPGTVNSDGSPEQAERRRRLRGGHRRRLRTRRRQRLAGVPAVRARPQAHSGDGQLRREHRRRQGHLGVVPAAAAHAGPAAGDRRRRGRDLVLRGGRLVQLRPVAQAAVGCAPAGRHVPGARRGSADRHLHRRRRGATCVSRWRGRRRRPTSRASSPTTPTCPPTSGSRSPRRGCRCWRPHSSSWDRRRRC